LVQQLEPLTADDEVEGPGEVLQFDGGAPAMTGDPQVEIPPTVEVDRPVLQPNAGRRVRRLYLPCKRQLEVGLGVEDGSLLGEGSHRRIKVEHQ